MQRIKSMEELEKKIDSNRGNREWTRLIGFYNQVRKGKTDDIEGHMSAMLSLYKSLYKKGYRLSKEVLKSLLDEANNGE